MLKATTTSDPLLSGFNSIAEILDGKLRAGSLMLIEGEKRSGKSVLAQHLAHGTLGYRENALAYYVTDCTGTQLVADMASFSLDVSHDCAIDRLRIYKLGQCSSARNSERFLKLLTDNIRQQPARFNLVMVDSVTIFMSHIKPISKIDFFLECKSLCSQGRSIVLVADNHVFEQATLARVHDICDYYLRLRTDDKMLQTGQIDDRQIKTLEVLKAHGIALKNVPSVKFEIQPKVGIVILPIFNVRM